MSVLITGGAGFIGSNLTIEMAKTGLRNKELVVVDYNLDNCNYLKDVIKSQGLEDATTIICADYSNDDILQKIRDKQFEQVVHLAAVPRVSYSVEHPAETTKENIYKFSLLLEACCGSCDKLIFASSSSVYGGSENLPTSETEPLDPQSPYALHKKVGEEMCSLFSLLYEIDTVCFRFFNVFGPHQFGDSPYSTVISAWCHAITHGSKLRLDGTGEVSRDFCYVTNVCDILMECLKSTKKYNAECFNIACGERSSLIEILDHFKNEYNISEDDIDHTPPRAGDVMHTCADMTKTYKEFNVNKDSQISFWDGLRETEEWWKTMKKVKV